MNGLPIRGLLCNTFQLSTARALLCLSTLKRGLSVSYDRIVQLSIEMANGVIDLFEEDGVVCPT